MKTALIALALLLLPAVAMAKPMMPTYYPACQEVVQSTSLSADEKVARLRDILKNERPTVLISFVAQFDKPAARTEALAVFRNPATSRQDKLIVAKQLHQWLEQPSFIDEYAPWLLSAILDGGEAEFMAVRPEHEPTAVGELAFMSNGFEGFKKADFDRFKDPQLTAILTRCLAAPDRVYGNEQGCVVRGKPDEATGRNTGRQHLPIALARLNATDAVPKLVEIIRTHHDIYLRTNAAHAVTTLGQPPDWKAVETFLRDNLDKNYNRTVLFEYGKGLLQRGDAAGVEYMSPKYWVASKDLSESMYYANEPLELLAKVRSPLAEAVLLEIIELPSLRAGFLFDPQKVTVSPAMAGGMAGVTPEKILADYRGQLIVRFSQFTAAVKFQQATGLMPAIRSINFDTRDETIRTMSRQMLLAPAAQ